MHPFVDFLQNLIEGSGLQASFFNVDEVHATAIWPQGLAWAADMVHGNERPEILVFSCMVIVHKDFLAYSFLTGSHSKATISKC